MKYKHVTISMRGTCSADGVNTSLSTYSTPEEFFKDHGDEIEPGSLVLDLRPVAHRNDAARLAVRSPMIDVRITDDSIARVADLVSSSAFGRQMMRGFGWQDSDAPTTGEPGPLDSISPAAHARWWQQYGATVGLWNGQAVQAWGGLIP